jgi:hypothetical protein
MSPSSSGSKNKGSKKPECLFLLHALSFLIFFFDFEDGGSMFLRNIVWLSGLHGIIFQKRELFIITAVRTSNL